MQVDIAQYCLYLFWMSQKTQEAVNKWRTAPFLLSVDRGDSHIEFGPWGRLSTFQTEIQMGHTINPQSNYEFHRNKPQLSKDPKKVFKW